MKGKLEKIVIGLMIPATIFAIMLFVKDCNNNKYIPKEQEPQKEIKTTYNITYKKTSIYSIY